MINTSINKKALINANIYSHTPSGSRLGKVRIETRHFIRSRWPRTINNKVQIPAIKFLFMELLLRPMLPPDPLYKKIGVEQAHLLTTPDQERLHKTGCPRRNVRHLSLCKFKTWSVR